VAEEYICLRLCQFTSLLQLHRAEISLRGAFENDIEDAGLKLLTIHLAVFSRDRILDAVHRIVLVSIALEMTQNTGQKLIVVYEPLTNRRQHYMLEEYHDVFEGAEKLYWLPSYLAREDSAQRIIPPAELISHLADPSIAEPMERDGKLKQIIQKHLEGGGMVVGMAGGGGGSLDDWLRAEFKV